MGFLNRIVDIIAQSEKPGDYTIVTPNRRASLFLKKFLLEHEEIRCPVWLPQFFSIEDFVASMSELRLVDRFSQIFMLYTVYKEIFDQPKPFDAYYSWGQVVLSDFEDIDLALADRNLIFEKLKAFSEIDEAFGPSGPMMQGFTTFAGKLETLYTTFTNQLLQVRQAYYGMAVRYLLDSFDASQYKRLNTIIFAGFYALSKAEEALVQALTASGSAKIAWDIDRYYLEDNRQEAGVFFRHSALIQDGGREWLTGNLLENEIDINIIGVPGRVAQAKAMGALLKQQTSCDADSAVVMPDETLLFPVLHSLPESASRINVTMGYPLNSTSMFHLVSALLEMHLSRRDDGLFRFSDLRSFLMHPYILKLDHESIRNVLHAMQENNEAFINGEHLGGISEEIGFLFEESATAPCIIKMLKALFILLVNTIRDDDRYAVEIEIISHFYRLVHKLEESIDLHSIEMTLATFWMLFKEIVDSEKVPFLGEPLQGLQVMGLLETRTLNFRNIYLLSANEGILPAGKNQNSFIPNEVRHELGLPTQTHRDAIYAYTLFRLIGGAEKVFIFYNTLNDAFGKGEKSRFVDQLIHEFPKKNGRARVQHSIWNFDSKFKSPEELSIPKDERLIMSLKAMTFSPSRLQTYINCPLKFYLQYIAGLTAADDVYESPDAKVFGQVIHGIMQSLFSPLVGEILTLDHISMMKRRVVSAVKDRYRIHMHNVDTTRGRNYLTCKVIEILISRYLDSETPGKIIVGVEETVEKTVQVDGLQIRMRGTMDRIEGRGEVIDIIDFKTGIVSSLSFDLYAEWKNEDLLVALRKTNHVLQLLCYMYLASGFLEKKQGSKCRAGIFSFRDQGGRGKTKFLQLPGNRPISLENQETSVGIAPIIGTVISHILDPSIPFKQTEDDKKCTYCSYREICGK